MKNQKTARLITIPAEQNMKICDDVLIRHLTCAPRGLSVNRQTKFADVVKYNDMRVAVFVAEQPPLRMKIYPS